MRKTDAIYLLMLPILFHMVGALASYENSQFIGITVLRPGAMRSHKMYSELLANQESDKFYIGYTLLRSYTKKQ